MLKSRRTARCALIAMIVAAPAIAFAAVTGTAAAIPSTCSAEASSNANGSHILLTNGSSTSSSSSSGTGSHSQSQSSSSFSATFVNGVLTINSCSVSASLVVQADGQRYCEASATHNGVTHSVRNPNTGTASTCDAFASA